MIELLTAVHLLYDRQCCEDQHCHPVPCEEITIQGTGWEWHRRFFDRSTFRISPDGACHVCVTALAPICIYLPTRT